MHGDIKESDELCGSTRRRLSGRLNDSMLHAGGNAHVSARRRASSEEFFSK